MIVEQERELTWRPSLIAFTDKEPKDWMVPSRWGTVGLHSHYVPVNMLTYLKIDKREDPYAPQQSNGCCIVM